MSAKTRTSIALNMIRRQTLHATQSFQAVAFVLLLTYHCSVNGRASECAYHCLSLLEIVSRRGTKGECLETTCWKADQRENSASTSSPSQRLKFHASSYGWRRRETAIYFSFPRRSASTASRTFPPARVDVHQRQAWRTRPRIPLGQAKIIRSRPP